MWYFRERTLLVNLKRTSRSYNFVLKSNNPCGLDLSDWLTRIAINILFRYKSGVVEGWNKLSIVVEANALGFARRILLLIISAGATLAILSDATKFEAQ